MPNLALLVDGAGCYELGQLFHCIGAGLFAIDGGIEWSSCGQGWGAIIALNGVWLKDIAQLTADGHSYSCAKACAGQSPAGVFGCFFHGVGRLVLGIGAEVADDTHAAAFVQGCFHFGGQGDVFDKEFCELETEFVEFRFDLFGYVCGDLIVVGGEVQNGNFCFCDGVHAAGDGEVPQLFVDAFYGEFGVGSGHFFYKYTRIFYTKGKTTEGAKAYGAELCVAEHDGVAGAPFLIDELPGADKEHVGFKRAVETIFPSFQRGKDGHVLGGKGIHAGGEDVCDGAFVHEYGPLRLAYSELAVHFYLVVVTGEFPNDGVG